MRLFPKFRLPWTGSTEWWKRWCVLVETHQRSQPGSASRLACCSMPFTPVKTAISVSTSSGAPSSTSPMLWAVKTSTVFSGCVRPEANR